MNLQENQPLAPLTTFEIGGPARWFIEAATESDIVAAVNWAHDRQLPLFVLGSGSNLLVADAGFPGLVLKINLLGIEVVPFSEKSTGFSEKGTSFSPYITPPQSEEAFAPEGYVLYRVAAGEDWAAFVQSTILDDCAGLESLSGIPGTVGATPVQNVGAYGHEVASLIHLVRAYDRFSRAFVEFTPAQCAFAYRHSRFNSTDRDRYIVTRVDYLLTPHSSPSIRYAELQRALAEVPNPAHQNSSPTLAQVAAAVLQLRQAKGMIRLASGATDSRSAGSFFKNPIVPAPLFAQIAQNIGKEPPHFPAPPDPQGQPQVKIPAAWLIEQAGFPKGYTLGRAALSTRHTLALTNLGQATSDEVLALAQKIRSTVLAHFGIHLEMEPVLLGF